MSDLEDITNTINQLWNEAYDGEPVTSTFALKARLVAIFDDRKCWMDNAKFIQTECSKLEKKLQKYEKDSVTD